MASTDENQLKNVKYLYLVLTAAGPPSIDWKAVSDALELKSGATTKRWSRLKQAMADDKNPGPNAYQFLWLCVKHQIKGDGKSGAPDWTSIANKCGLPSAGAASKRYSRMKQAMEAGEAAPATPSKAKGKTNDTVATPSKRKRGALKPKDEGAGNASDDTVDDGPSPTKKARATPKKATGAGRGKGKKGEAATKTEELENVKVESEGEDVIHTFAGYGYDEQEAMKANERIEEWIEQV